MKKIIYIIMITVITVVSFGTLSNANSIAPEYDATFDDGKGIFYANGTSITINENESGNTVVYWDGGQQEVQPTVRIIGAKQLGRR